MAYGGLVHVRSTRPPPPSSPPGGVGISVGGHESHRIHGLSMHAFARGGIGFGMNSLPYVVQPEKRRFGSVVVAWGLCIVGRVAYLLVKLEE